VSGRDCLFPIGNGASDLFPTRVADATPSETIMLKFIQAKHHSELSSVRIDAIRWCHRKIPLSRGRHVTGRYSPGPGKSAIRYESLAERKAMEHFLALPGVHAVLSQPFTVEFSISGIRRRYTPDLLVVADPLPFHLVRNGFGALTVLEVKATFDPHSRALLDFKLQLVTHATGLPAMFAVPLRKDGSEVHHAP
jgi:hypothetical protein